MEKTLHVLLVGEGNFSFSVWLCDSDHIKYHITATCFESEDMVCRQPPAWKNVLHLRERGAVVHCGVDATRLKDTVFVNIPYDRVIFNFPHCGRKAGVKKNRDLLSKFFLSCAEVLAENGDVHVALCKGQGGTPADQPMREWHNSWQVVAMAAKAGFILTAVNPFGSEQFDGYQCTGYRSQDKSFHVEGALTHIFTRSLPLEINKPLKLINRLTDVLSDFKGSDNEERKTQREIVKQDACHPTKILNEELKKFMEKSVKLKYLEDTFPLVCEKSNSPDYLWCFVSEDTLLYTKYMDQNSSDSEAKQIDSYPTCKGHSSNCLRPSLAYFTNEIIGRPDFIPGIIYSLNGLVFRKCLASQWSMPAYNELMFLCHCENDNIMVQMQLLMDVINNALTSIHTFSSGIKKTEMEKTFKSMLTFLGSVHSEHYTATISFNYSDKIIGNAIALSLEKSDNNTGLLMTLNLDLITMCLLDITDWRMLWTTDHRFIQQYNPRQLKTFQSFSLYPPYYTHDISFWVGKESKFDNLEFHVLAQIISEGTISDIQLLDQFENVNTGQTSLCYRITYQSCDGALSYELASELQLLIREKLQKYLHVTLR